MNLHVDEFVLSVFTPLCPSLSLSLSPWFYLFCLSSCLLWPLIRRFILHLICLSLLSRLVPLCSPVMVISVRWGLTRERSDVEASYWTRETETDRKWAALLLLGETPWLQSWNRGRERVCVSPCFLSRWHWSAVPYSAGTLKRITDSNDQHPHLLSHVPCLGIYWVWCLLPPLWSC